MLDSLTGKIGIALGEPPLPTGLRLQTLDASPFEKISRSHHLDFVLIDAKIFITEPMEPILKALGSRLVQHGIIGLFIPAQTDEPFKLAHQILASGPIEFTSEEKDSSGEWLLFRYIKPAPQISMPIEFRWAEFISALKRFARKVFG